MEEDELEHLSTANEGLRRELAHKNETIDRHVKRAEVQQEKVFALEAEAESLTEQLSASNMGGTSGPLVDREGFPRADVDVHATRLLRNRLACLNTDHRELMGQIEQSMHALGSERLTRTCGPNAEQGTQTSLSVSDGGGVHWRLYIWMYE